MAFSMFLTLICPFPLLQEGGDDFPAEYQRFHEEWRKEQLAAQEAMRGAKTPQERQKIWNEKNPDGAYLPKFQDLAERAKGTPTAAKALVWVYLRAKNLAKGREAAAALDRLLESHLDAPELEEIAGSLQHGGGERDRDALQTIARKSTQRTVQAAARFSLARRLLHYRQATEEEQKEAREHLESIRRDYADTKYAAQVEPWLFELENLQIGKTAPDFEATDVEGKAFQLSDYRGKVVVLDFWGFW